MNKQIEDMQSILYQGLKPLKETYGTDELCSILYEAGYRRQEDIAKEIIQVMDDSIEEPVSEYHKGYMDAIADWKRAIKKKYGVEEDG